MKAIKLLLPILLLLFFPDLVTAQKAVSQEEQTWFGFFSQARLTDRWGIWGDFHFRLKDQFLREPAQFIGRFGPTFYLNDDIRFTAAYAFINHFPAEGHENISQPEHRPWQQVQWFTRLGKSRMMQWIRLEERFRRNIKDDDELADGYRFNWRVRYNSVLFLPLTQKGLGPKTWQWVVNDEVFLNFGKNVVYNVFDQNRFFTGLVYQTNAHAHFQLGYMNVYQQLSAGNKFKSQHTIRLFYFHNFDFRKK